MGPFPSALYLLIPLAHPSARTGSLFSLPALLRGLCGPESHNPSGLCVCVHAVLFYALALAEESPPKELNGAKRLVQTDRRNMLSATEVSVLMQACVQEWAYEHAACVHVLSFRTDPARHVNSSMTLCPCKHRLILPATIPLSCFIGPRPFADNHRLALAHTHTLVLLS